MKQTELELAEIQNNYYVKHQVRISPDGVLKIKRDYALKDLAFISRLNVQILFISRCHNISFENISSKSCEDITVKYCKLKSLTGISQLSALNYLNLSFDKLNDLGPLQNMYFLETLNVEFNEISDLSPLSKLTKLKDLYIQNNKITNLYNIRNLSRLLTLYAGDNKISDLNGIQHMKNLKYLQLHNNQITDISPLQECRLLEYLLINDNQITNITPLQHNAQLMYMSIELNFITDIQVINQLQNFSGFRLENQQQPSPNQIQTSTRMKTIFTVRSHLEIIPQKRMLIRERLSSSIHKGELLIDAITNVQLNLSDKLLQVFGTAEHASQ
ncbi:Conserved_hypothetical protein [Hexamita inflata]|uniref:Uncharacterized protein n=1 Tax=Hexamita inflata TaxID=28002 RepID=A0AA86UYC5_9EUKA|nr:Conserved hypothetical protein [Hexamita inflata]